MTGQSARRRLDPGAKSQGYVVKFGDEFLLAEPAGEELDVVVGGLGPRRAPASGGLESNDPPNHEFTAVPGAVFADVRAEVVTFDNRCRADLGRHRLLGQANRSHQMIFVRDRSGTRLILRS
jgi:hypothetical protein